MKKSENKSNFDKQKLEYALKWLEEKWPVENRVCEVCSHSNWSVAEDLIAPITFRKNSMMVGGNSYPQVMVICSNCGNTKYFNAVTIGIVEGGVSAEKRN